MRARWAARSTTRLATLGLLLLGLAAAGPAQAQNRFWLQNGGGQTIQEAYVSPSRLSNWGPDILGSGVLGAGQQVRVTPNFGDCVLDVRVKYADGRSEERRNLNACQLDRIAFGAGGGGGAGASISGGGAGASISGARGGNPSFNFVNQGRQTIRELYVSLSSQRSWGGDRLGTSTLGPGGSVFVDLPTGGTCTVDIRVVYADGSANERRGVESCSRTDIGWR